MRKLTGLWQALEKIPGLAAIPAFWKLDSGKDFPLLEPFLRPTELVGTAYPCPHPTGGYCPRAIIDLDEKEYVAICRDPWKLCEELPLTTKEVLVHKLDVAAFTKALAEPLGIRWQEPEERGDYTWSIGISARRSARNQPVFFIALPESARFRAVFQSLLLELSGPFVTLVPTNRHRTVEVQRYVQARGIGIISLEDDLFLDDDGKFIVVDPLEASEEVGVTPVEGRVQAVRAFIAKHRCKSKDVYEAAGIDESDFYKWRRGDLPDHSSKCQDVERILQRGLPHRRGP